jgi:hypothetical protein
VRVHVVCQDLGSDRVIPRFARLLRDRLGWTASAEADSAADVLYLFPYFEAQRAKGLMPPTAAYFTHKEEEPTGNAKAKLFDQVAAQVSLRVAMCRLYGESLSQFGPTVMPPLPVEQDRFTISSRMTGRKPVVGLSGYTYSNHRKGEDLVSGMLASKIAERVEWRASGRGWPIPTKRYTWDEMPRFYQGLDVLVCPSRVEGGPMPPLEALAAGVSVVIPRGVGILDELPDVPGIYRYERGDLPTLLLALEHAAYPDKPPDPKALRASVAAYSVEAFVDAHRDAFATAFGSDHAGIAAETEPIRVKTVEPIRVRAAETTESVARGTGSTRGIYCVAFGAPACESAKRMMLSAKRHMPDVPICLCAASKIGPEDVLVRQPDSDVGGRRAKMRAYELAPAEWESVLYLDADTEIVAPIYQYFEWVEDGWELAITHDIQSMETLHAFSHKATPPEVAETLALVGTPHVLQLAGGAFCFRRNERVGRFFARWQAEWERYGQRDQGPLLRALHAEPLKVWVLGNHWNTFPKFQPHQATAGLLHWPGDARRWDGQIPGRIDSTAAWEMVKRHEARR